MRKSLLGLLVMLLLPVSSQAQPRRYEDQVVTLKVTYQRWDQDRPWMKLGPRTLTASAVVIDGPYLLVEAQLVTEATLIQVEKLGHAHRAYAKVAHMDPEVNLALLTVEEPGFFDDLVPVPLVETLPVSGTVHSVRWNNRQLEIADSRVTRIEVRTSRYGNLKYAFLLATTDLDSGGSSEPVFKDGALVGLTVGQNKQLAQIMPASVIRSYLQMVLADAEYEGFPALPLVWQTNNDPALSAYLELEGPPRGVVIRDVHWGSSACGVLEPRDILLALDGHPIDSNGTYEHPRYGRMLFAQIVIEGHAVGDVIRAQILRDGQQLDLPMTLRAYPEAGRLIPWREELTPPPFHVAGGLVFRELTGEYLRTWGKEWKSKAPPTLVHRQTLGRHGQETGKRRLVILAYVLPAAYNLGYHQLGNLVVAEVNSRPVQSIDELIEAFAHPESGFHTIVFEPNGQRREVVLDAQSFQQFSGEIAAGYNLPLASRLPATPPPDMGRACSATGEE